MPRKGGASAPKAPPPLDPPLYRVCKTEQNSDFRGPWVTHRKCRSMGVKIPDFTSHMPMLHRRFHCHGRSLSVTKKRALVSQLVRASAAPHHPIHLSVTSQTERDITSTNLMYAWHGVHLACFRLRPREQY